LLIAVSILYGCAVLSQVPSLVAFNWDEVVYASQVRPGVAPVPMSAPRAWGMPIMLAPVAVLTQEVIVLRLYLTVLAVVGMYAAFQPWLGVFGPRAATAEGAPGDRNQGEGRGGDQGPRAQGPGAQGPGMGRPGAQGPGGLPAVSAYAVPLAAGLFATLWSTFLYGSMAYPNLWLAFALVAGVGWFCRGLREPERIEPVVGMGVAFAVASLLRPTDAAALALPLLVAGLVRLARRARRAAALVAAVAGGLAIGWAVWVAEAFLRFGDPLNRLREGAEVNEAGIGFSLLRHLEAVDGPALLCRPPEVCADLHWFEVSWWFVLPVLVAAGFVFAEAVRPALTLIVACAVTFALPYLLLFDYANPRFMQPAYALLMIPAAAGLVRLPLSRRTMRVVTPMLVAALAAHLAGQVMTLQRVVGRVAPIYAAQREQADALRAEGVTHPCVLIGRGAIQLGYLTGCRAVRTAEDPDPDEETVVKALDGDEQVVLLVRRPSGRAPEGWVPLEVPDGAAYLRQGTKGSSN